ncbi:MAG: hypothetical protein ACRCWF_09160 [Beijerinckiaceae bacterium]
MPIFIAGLVYFGIVFGAGFVLGVFRELVLTPVYDKTAAVLIESPFLILAIIIGAWIAVHRRAIGQSRLSLFLVGLIGLVLLQVADFGVGLGLRGITIQEQLDYLKTTAGQIYLGLLAIFLIMPMIVGPFSRPAQDHSKTHQSLDSTSG